MIRNYQEIYDITKYGYNQARIGDLMADVFVSGMWWLAGVKIYSIVLYKVTEVHNVSVCGIEYCVVLGSFIICKILCALTFCFKSACWSNAMTFFIFLYASSVQLRENKLFVRDENKNGRAVKIRVIRDGFWIIFPAFIYLFFFAFWLSTEMQQINILTY